MLGPSAGNYFQVFDLRLEEIKTVQPQPVKRARKAAGYQGRRTSQRVKRSKKFQVAAGTTWGRYPPVRSIVSAIVGIAVAEQINKLLEDGVAVPAGLARSRRFNRLRQSGRLFCTIELYGFLARVSHRCGADAAPTEHARGNLRHAAPTQASGIPEDTAGANWQTRADARCRLHIGHHNSFCNVVSNGGRPFFLGCRLLAGSLRKGCNPIA
jgi:hypothetical protein